MPSLLLTQSLVESLRAPGEYADLALPNFGLRIQGGRRAYYVRIRERLRGRTRRVRVTVGYAPRLTLKAARQAAAEKLRQHDEGYRVRVTEDVAEARDAAAIDPTTITIAQLCTLFLEEHRPPIWSVSHYRNSRWFAEAKVIPAWGPERAAAIDRHAIKVLLKAYARSVGVNANRLHAFISRLFRWAVKEEYLERMPALLIAKPHGRERARERVLTASEIRRFWAALDAVAADPATLRRTRTFTDLWRLRLLTAQREQSLRRLEWAWIDWEAGLIEFPADAMKGKRQPHAIALTPLVRAILERRLAVASQLDRFVFATRDAASTAPGRMPGIPIALPNFKGHDLRRTATTLMTQNGVSRFDVARVLNHRDGTVTGIYDRYEYFAEKRRALEILDRVITTLVDPAAVPSTVLPFTRS